MFDGQISGVERHERLMMAGKKIKTSVASFPTLGRPCRNRNFRRRLSRLSTSYGPLTTPKLITGASSQLDVVPPGTSAGLGPYLALFSLSMSGPPCLSRCVCRSL